MSHRPDHMPIFFSALWRSIPPDPETGEKMALSLRLRWPSELAAGEPMRAWLADELEYIAKRIRADPDYLSASKESQEEGEE